jgi:hypothetical protein
MNVVILTNPLWRVLLATPSVLGMTLALSMTSSLAQSQPPAEQSLVAAQAVSPGLEPPRSPQLDSTQEQQAAFPSASLAITQTSVSPFVSAQAIQPVPESQNPSVRFTPLQAWAESIAPSSPANTNTKINPATQMEPIGETYTKSPVILVQSTNSRDLQPTGSQSPSGDGLQVPLAQSSDSTETPSSDSSAAQPTTSQSTTKWHVLFQPYIYIPITIYGSTSARNFRGKDVSRDFAISPSEIRTKLQNDLDFVFFGRLEAWTPNYHLGLLADVDYISFSSKTTLNRDVRRPGLVDFVPSQVTVASDSQTWVVDLAAAYRFYNPSQVNPNGVSTEFDLGPVLFDLFGGINITGVDVDLNLTTDLGGEREFNGGKTIVSPLLGGRFRWNASPKLAVVTAGSVSGFGISGLMQWGVLGGIDWMFSGNTSLGLGYRFGFFNYDKGTGREFSLEANQNGPYLSFSFRF